MSYPLEWLYGHIIHTKNKAQYQVYSAKRLAEQPGHSYVLQIGLLDSLPSTHETFLASFSLTFQVESRFGQGEEGILRYLLFVLEFSLDQNPAEYLEQDEQGRYLLSFQ